ncbi:MAG TPA: hypothetical protein VLW25_14800 [Bryobacteraceae bacterium]|nr:hypothetical protein [Bryobacteraceae bacterium]
MCRRSTIRLLTLTGILVAVGAQAQNLQIDWRHIGNSAMELGLPSVATGPVSRVWYSADGSTLFAQALSGRTYETTDFERWSQVKDPRVVVPPAHTNPAAATLPETGLKLAQASSSGRIYAAGSNVYRSDDGGASWANLTAFRGVSILGGGLTDTAVSPRDPDEVTVAAASGAWRSVDGGLTWSGLNEFLPNLPAGHLLAVPAGTRGVRLAVAGGAAEIEWAPGEKTSWKPLDPSDLQRDQDLKSALSQVLNRTVTAIQTAKDFIYAGDSEGRLLVSSDGGTSWGTAFRLTRDAGPVEAIWVDRNDPRVAIATLGARANTSGEQARPASVIRTMNGGIFWDDITSNLPDNAVAHGVTADRTAGAIYVATDAGVFFTITDLAAAGSATAWTSLAQNLPAVAATDVQLDAGGNQLYAALEGYGVYVAIAPHRLRDARVVSAADLTSRAAAPGALLSVLGTRVQSAASGDTTVPVLDASEASSQIQVPFEAKGDSIALSVQAPAGRFTVGLALKPASPAIFVDSEGAPLILDASTGVLLDSTKPAHPSGRVQVLATGLGQVTPDWPTGLAAPLNDPPRVVAPIRAYLDGAPVEVTQATLAPGYIGFYLVELQLPRIANAGSSDLVLEAEGQQSNHVRLYLQQ